MVTNAMATCLLSGVEGREELRAHRPHTGTSEQDPRKVAALGLGDFCPPLRTPACKVPSQQGKRHFPSALDEWLALASQETVGFIQVQTQSPSHPATPRPHPSVRKEGRSSRGGGVGLPSKVGEGQLEQGPHCTEATRSSQAGQASACLPGPGTRIPLGLSHPSYLATHIPAGLEERGACSDLSPASAERSSWSHSLRFASSQTQGEVRMGTMPVKLAGTSNQGLSDLRPRGLGQNVITNPACLEG